MPLLSGKGHVGENIKEFRQGPTYQHTEDKFGKGRADKQATAVALHQQDKAHGAHDHHAAVAKMHPEHVHRLIQDAHAGKYGPEAQQTAQQAMQAPAAPGAPGEAPPPQAAPPGRDYGAIFNGQPDQEQDEPPPSRASMFAGSRGGM